MSGDTTIPGASRWEQDLYDHVMGHLADEADVIDSYVRLVEETDSPAFAYLAELILEDERRHHRILVALADAVRVTAELRPDASPIPDLAMWGTDRDRILADTERYLEVERRDNWELERLAQAMRTVSDTTMWPFLVRIIQLDNEKHRRILKFIRDQARRKP